MLDQSTLDFIDLDIDLKRQIVNNLEITAELHIAGVISSTLFAITLKRLTYNINPIA